MKTPIVTLLPLVALVALTACSGAPKKIDSLESARAAYSTASADKVVVKHASGELDDARAALANADRSWKEDEKRSRTEHYAYIASQKVKIANLISQRKVDDARLENMNIERQQVQLDARAKEVDRARDQTLAMQKQLKDMKAKVTARGIVATLGDVLFDVGEATLKNTSAVNIDKLARFMSSDADRTAIVEGHTDNLGDEDFNLDLARERAFAVRAALIARGVAGSRITITSAGESRPVADNSTADGRRQNRRVEVIFPDLDTQVSELGN